MYIPIEYIYIAVGLTLLWLVTHDHSKCDKDK